jgi:diguanylate cyclase (GGDEF)-like protein
VIKVLLIEDNPDDALILKRMISKLQSPEIELDWCDSCAEGHKKLEENNFDFVILDLSLPDSHGLDTVKKTADKYPRIPVVVMTGLDDDEVGMQAVQNGAQDYLIKGQVNSSLLGRVIRYSMERKRSEIELEEKNMRLEELTGRLKTMLDQTDGLVRFNREISKLDFRKMMRVAKKMLPDLFMSELFSLLLLNNEGRKLTVVANNHPSWTQKPDSYVIPEDEESIMWDAIKKRKMIAVEDISRSSYADENRGRKKYKNQSVICAPLSARGKIIGVVTLNNFSSETLSGENLSNIQRVVDHLALAINNVLLYQRIEEISVIDELTEFYNRRYLYKKVVSERKRIARSGENLSMLLIDIDKFKDINDTYGHNAGDKVLKIISRQIKAALRITDIPCRYGGDEFLIFLPDTDSNEAVILARRLKEKFETMAIDVDSEQKIKVTLSIGVAEYNTEETISAMMKRADTALYEAKKTGRNKFVLA